MDVKMWYLPVFQRQILYALLHLRELFGSIFNAVLDDLSVFHSDIVAFMFTVLWYLGLILLLLVPPLVSEPELEIIGVIGLHKVGIEEVDPVPVKLSVKIVKLLEMLVAFGCRIDRYFHSAVGYGAFYVYHTAFTVAVPNVTPDAVNS